MEAPRSHTCRVVDSVEYKILCASLGVEEEILLHTHTRTHALTHAHTHTHIHTHIHTTAHGMDETP